MKQMTLSQYRTIDLGILLGVLAVSQFFISVATYQWFPDQLYVVSPAAAITALVMMRWGGWAAIHAASAGLLFSWLSGGGWHQFLIYGAGNLAALAALPVLRKLGKERVRKDVLLSLGFGLGVQVLMQLGRGVLAMILGFGWEAALGFITTDSLSVIFTLFITWIVRQADGLFEDQKHYLLRLQSEHQNEGREQF